MAAAAVTHTIQTLLLLLFISRLREGKYQNGTSLFAPIHCGTTRLSFFAQKKKIVQHGSSIKYMWQITITLKACFLKITSSSSFPKKGRPSLTSSFSNSLGDACCAVLGSGRQPLPPLSSSFSKHIKIETNFPHTKGEKEAPFFRPRTHAEEEEEDAICHSVPRASFCFPLLLG